MCECRIRKLIRSNIYLYVEYFVFIDYILKTL